MLEIVTRLQYSLLEVVLSLTEVDKVDHHVLHTELHTLEVVMIVESWITGLKNALCGSYFSKYCKHLIVPRLRTMMRGIYLGHSYGLSTLLVEGGAFGIAITTSGVQVKVEHSQFYYSTSWLEAGVSCIPSLDPLRSMHDLESEWWCSLEVLRFSSIGKWKLTKKIHLLDGVMLLWFTLGLVPLGHYQLVDYVDMPLAGLVSFRMGFLAQICGGRVVCGLVVSIFQKLVFFGVGRYSGAQCYLVVRMMVVLWISVVTFRRKVSIGVEKFRIAKDRENALG
ncbi:hypothetical protein H5410_028031, partial [Solanum commersonii]